MTFVQIRKWRADLGLTRREMADMLGVAYKTVTAWECGYSTPSRRFLDFMQSEAFPSKEKAIEQGVNRSITKT